jgi:hypothetical protein
MINLIPPSAQKQVKREYWIRVVTVWMFLAGISSVLSICFFIPAYVLVHNQLDSFSLQFKEADTNSESLKASEKAIVQANAISTLLTQSESTVSFSTVISEIEKVKTPDILLFDFSVMRTGDVFTSIMVSGTASSRASLSTFREALDANDKDIPFTITITPDKAKPKQNI